MRLDLILCDRKSYSYEGYCAARLTSYFEKKNFSYKTIYLSDGVLNDYIHYLKEDPPNSMVSFCEFFHHDRPFCDIVQVPQFFWAMHSFSEGAHFLGSDFGVLGLPHPCTLQNTVYLPHGVEKGAPQQPLFDTICFSSLIDLDHLEKLWKDFFPKEIAKLIHAAIETGQPPYEAVMSVSEGISLLLPAVETYYKAKWIVETVSAFEAGELHVFGEHKGANWLKKLPKGVHLHDKLPYTECLEVITQSKKILLNPYEPHWKIPAAAAGLISCETPPPSWEEQIDKLIEIVYEN